MIPETDQIFTEVELSTLEKAINETTIWKNETLAEQNKLSPTEKPVLLSKDIELKIAALDREVQYLLNKAKFAKPKPRKEKNTTKTDSGKNATAASEPESTIPPTEGKQEDIDKLEDIGPAMEPPAAEQVAIGSEPGSDPGSKEGKREAGGESRKNDEL